jgi:hypothetical protein
MQKEIENNLIALTRALGYKIKSWWGKSFRLTIISEKEDNYLGCYFQGSFRHEKGAWVIVNVDCIYRQAKIYRTKNYQKIICKTILHELWHSTEDEYNNPFSEEDANNFAEMTWNDFNNDIQLTKKEVPNYLEKVMC